LSRAHLRSRSTPPSCSRAGESPDRFADSSKFDLLVEANRLPPKVVVALAAERTSGRVLTPDEFSGGDSSAAFRLLMDRGFQIVTKHCTSPETLRTWVRRTQVDAGDRPGVTSDERARMMELEKEVRELRRANEILRKASAYFAQAELDRRPR